MTPSAHLQTQRMPGRRHLAVRLAFGLLLSAAPAAALAAAAGALQEYAVRAAVSLNFARFSDWPEGSAASAASVINLCVLGDELVQEAFNLVDNKQAGTKVVAVIDFAGSKNMEQCQLLYTSGQSNAEMKRLLAESSRQHVLTLSDNEDFLAQGGMVYLPIVDGKIDLQINLQAVKKAGITISSRVLKLAKIVNP